MKKRLTVAGQPHNTSFSVIPLEDDIKINVHLIKVINLLIAAKFELGKYKKLVCKDNGGETELFIKNAITEASGVIAENVVYKIEKKYNQD